MWANNTKTFKQTIDKHLTMSSLHPLSRPFTVTLKFVHLKSNGHVSLGLSEKQQNGERKWVGDQGANSQCVEYGFEGSGHYNNQTSTWTLGSPIYKEGDLVTLIYAADQSLAVQINKDAPFVAFKNVLMPTAYVAATLYYAGDDLYFFACE